MARRSRTASSTRLLLAAAAVCAVVLLGPAPAAAPGGAAPTILGPLLAKTKTSAGVALVPAAVLLALCMCLLRMIKPLLVYWRVMLFFWTGGCYKDLPKSLGLSAFSRAHLYSLASVPWLMMQPHYRTGTFQQDMLTNLRNVVLPTGFYGIPLSVYAVSRVRTVFAILVVVPVAAFVGSIFRRLRGLEPSASECFRRSLLAPTDWFQLWRLNCRLASMVALSTQSKDFELEDKWVFIQACQRKGIPVTPVMDMPVTLVAKDVLEEGGMGIHVLKNIMHGGRWILQEKLDNCESVNALLPENAPLSTVRVVTGSNGALGLLGAADGKPAKAVALATVWRAGRAGAATDHSSVMVNVPDPNNSEKLGTGSSSAHWYAKGWKSLGMPLSTADGSITHHPDTGNSLTGSFLPGATSVNELCERAHAQLMPTVPLAGWDVALCAPKDGGTKPELVLLEANLSCNFFRGSIAWDQYSELLDEHFAALDAWRKSG